MHFYRDLKWQFSSCAKKEVTVDSSRQTFGSDFIQSLELKAKVESLNVGMIHFCWEPLQMLSVLLLKSAVSLYIMLSVNFFIPISVSLEKMLSVSFQKVLSVYISCCQMKLYAVSYIFYSYFYEPFKNAVSLISKSIVSLHLMLSVYITCCQFTFSLPFLFSSFKLSHVQVKIKNYNRIRQIVITSPASFVIHNHHQFPLSLI